MSRCSRWSRVLHFFQTLKSAVQTDLLTLSKMCWKVKHWYKCTKWQEPHQVPGAVRSSQVTLDVWVEDLDCRLDKAAARKMLLVLNKRQPRLEQLVVGLHVNHVILIQLSKERKGQFIPGNSACMSLKPRIYSVQVIDSVQDFLVLLQSQFMTWCNSV